MEHEIEIGTVKMARSQGAFGFLIRADGGGDLFFHRRSCCPKEAFEQLRPGDQVQFRVSEGERGPEATDLRRL
jgi:CspA family cold shock protein